MIAHAENFWGVTAEISVRFKKPVPIGEELRVIGRITRDSNRFFEGSGEILLPDGSIAAEGQGKYMKLPLENIADFDRQEQEWGVVSFPDDPEFIEI
jgi:acyl-CoA thioesterase FadM